jgi:hypothetical protein
MQGGVFPSDFFSLLKIHVAVNIKTLEILSLGVTDEKVHDSLIMRRRVRHVLDNHDGKNVVMKSVLSDGAYDSNENFKLLDDEGIEPAIKVRKIHSLLPKATG